MIDAIKLTNFFSFADEVIHLQDDVNILIGINGSGKSNLIKAIQLLKIGVEGNSDESALRDLIMSRWGGFENIFCKSIESNEHQNSIGLEFSLNPKVLNKFTQGTMTFREEIIYKIHIIKKPSTDNYYISEEISTKNGFIYLNFINGEGSVKERQESGEIPTMHYDDYDPQELALSKISEFDKDRYLPLVIIKRAIKEISVYTYFDTTTDSKIRKAIPATSGANKLLPDGSNLAQVLNTIKIGHKNEYRRIEEQLKNVNEMFDGFDFNILGSGFFELMLSEKELDSAIHITHVSDGTLRYLCLLCIFCNPNRGSFICIDEPEVGLHPDMIRNVAKLILENSKESPFMVATHSDSFLNNFQLRYVRSFDKNTSNSTVISTFDENNFPNNNGPIEVGVLWRDGDLGANRW